MLAARILLPLYLAVVGWVTLGPVPWRTLPNETHFGVLGVRTWLDATTWTTGRPGEFLANIAMFVPLGILLRMAWPRLRARYVALAVIAIAGAIEVAQLPLERVSDPRDLVANTLGGLAGLVIASRVAAQRRAARPAGGGAA